MNRSASDVAKVRDIPLDQVVSRVREQVGEDRAQLMTDSRYRVGSEETRVVVFPRTAEELAEVLRLASRESWRVIPAGAGTWLEMGNRPAQFQMIVSTSRLDRILEYEPADLTATVEAGCPLSTFNEKAREQGQWIPLDPFGSAQSTIGATIATASYGPLRCGYGTPRDWLIGIRVAQIDGQLTRAGGKVVKNVAGYDLGKLYTGSFGSLAIVTETTFKLRSLAPAEKTLIFYAEQPGTLLDLVARIQDSPLQPAAMEMLSPQPRVQLPIETGVHGLALRFLHEPEAVDSQINEVTLLGGGCRRTVMSEADARMFWRQYHESETDRAWECSLRLTMLPAELPATLEEMNSLLPGTIWRAHAANGILRMHAEEGWLSRWKPKERARKMVEMRQRMQSRGGQLLILRAPDDLLDQVDVWGEAGQTAGLMHALKEKYDPRSLLNSGRFVSGI